MGYHTFTAGEVLTAANVNNFLMNQSVIVCTSSTRPASPVAGMTIFETDTGNLSVYSGSAWVPVGIATGTGAWTTYTPTFTNLTSPTGSFAYKQVGKTLFLRHYFTGGTVTANGVVTATLPTGLTSITGASVPLAAMGLANGAYAPGGSTTVTTYSLSAASGLSGIGWAGPIEVQ